MQLAQTLLYVLFHHYRVWGQKCSEAVCAAVHHWITQLTLVGSERANTLRALSRSTSMHRPPAVSWVGKNNSTATASITPHTRCLFSGALLYLPLPNWEWMSAHRGVENNGWGQLGTLSAKHHGELCLPEKPNMHIPLCGSQKLSNQCCCMGDNWINSQLCCQAFNGCELESAIVHTHRAHLDGNGEKSNSFPDKHRRDINTIMWLSLSPSLSVSHACARTYQRPQFWPTRVEYEPDALTNLWFIIVDFPVYKVCDGGFMRSVFNWEFNVFAGNPTWAIHFSLHVEGVLTLSNYSIREAYF